MSTAHVTTYIILGVFLGLAASAVNLDGLDLCTVMMTAMNDFVRDYIRQTPFISVMSPRAVDSVVPTRTTNCYG